MQSSFKKIFGITFLLSLILLVGAEWFINKTILTEHVVGWAFVAVSIAAMAGIIGQQKNAGH